MTIRFVRGWARRWVDLGVSLRFLVAGMRRFGPVGVLREGWRYLRSNRNLMAGAGDHYVARGGDVYAASALPPLGSEAFVRYLLDEVASFNTGQLSPLAWVMLAVSSRCPYRCRYCYAADELHGLSDAERTQAVALDRLVAAVADARRLGVPTVFLTGGEPVVRRAELGAVMDAGAGGGSVGSHGKGGQVGFWLVTTGWGVDRDLLRDLAARGLVGVVVSLDSRDEAAAVRSKAHPDAFRFALAAVEAAHAEGLLVSVDTMVPRGSPLLTPQGFESFVDFLVEHGVHFLNLFPPHPVGGARRMGLFPLMKADIDALEARTEENNRRPGRPLAYAAIAWERKRGCAGGQQFVYVDPQGGVRPCPFLDYTAGNIRDEGLEAIVARIRRKGEQDGCFHAVEGLAVQRRTR